MPSDAVRLIDEVRRARRVVEALGALADIGDLIAEHLQSGRITEAAARDAIRRFIALGDAIAPIEPAAELFAAHARKLLPRDN